MNYIFVASNKYGIPLELPTKHYNQIFIKFVMHFIEKPLGKFVDCVEENGKVESIDVIMLTLDAEDFLEKTLFSIYKEIPVKRLIVCDGGSKDNTIKILERFSRTVVFIKPEIRTTGKALEFLFSKIETKWFLLIDSDIILEENWYSKMLEYSDKYDVLENGNRINAYHFYREQLSKIKEDQRSLDMCHLVKKDSIKNYHCDDDFMWRYTDILLRQFVEKNGYKYGKVNATYHIHNETERIPYQSDNEKNFQELKFFEPKLIIHNQKKMEEAMIKHAKAIIKYLDPDFPMVKNDKNYETVISLLHREWIEENGAKWLKRYDDAKNKRTSMREIIKRRIFSVKSIIPKKT